MVPMLLDAIPDQLLFLNHKPFSPTNDSLEMRLGPRELATGLGGIPSHQRPLAQVGGGGQNPVGPPSR